MKIQSKVISAISLTFLACAPSYAALEKSANELRPTLNTIEIVNNTDDDIVYRVHSSSSANMYYGVEHRNTSKYHSKPGDSKATFEVGVCQQLNNLTGFCTKFKSKSLKNCLGHTYYNADKIDSITINSLTSCTVRCNDGTSTSCVSK